MEILLEIPAIPGMHNNWIVIEVSDESTNVFAEIKQQVLEKTKISEEQQVIYIGGVLLTGKEDNNFVLDRLSKKSRVNLEVLAPKQVALCQAIETVDLSSNPQIKIKSTNPLIVESEDRGKDKNIFGDVMHDVKYLSALSKALDELDITYAWRQGRDYQLHIDYPDQVLSDDFAEKLKASYKKELAKIENSLFYVSDPGLLRVSAMGVVLVVVFAIVAGLLAGTGVGAVIAFGLMAAAVAGLSLFVAYSSIKIGKGGGGGSPDLLADDPEKKIVQTEELEKDNKPDHSYTAGNLLKQQSTQIPVNSTKTPIQEATDLGKSFLGPQKKD